MIDLHFHLLPGIDDGPHTPEQALALARAAHAAGTTTIVATPHVDRHHRNTAATIAASVAAMNQALAAAGVELEVLPGAELAAPRVADLDEQELQALRLGGGPWLLLECPLGQSASGFDAIALYLKQAGHSILLAHPERCPAFQRDPAALRALVQAGMLTSLTAGSLVGRFGRTVRRFAERIAAEDMLHNVASDAHNTGRRPPGIAAELEQAGLGALTPWLTEAVPAAILAGAPIPGRPAAGPAPAAPRGRWRLGR